jgi:hypothetical protein
MIKHKFQKGDLVWANLRGYGVVFAIGRNLVMNHDEAVGDYAEIGWQNNLHGYHTKIFRGSIGWEKTHVRVRINLDERI